MQRALGVLLALLVGLTAVLGWAAWDQHRSVDDLRSAQDVQGAHVAELDRHVASLVSTLDGVESDVESLGREVSGGVGLFGDGLSDRLNVLEDDVVSLAQCLDSLIRSLRFGTSVFC